MDSRFAELPFRTRLVHEADLQARRTLHRNKFPGSEHDRQMLLMDYRNWKERMVNFPGLEHDRYGEDLLETSRDVVSRLYLNSKKINGVATRELKFLYNREFWVRHAVRMLGEFGNRDHSQMERMFNEQRNKFYKSMEDPVVKEKYLKKAREDYWVWGKKD
jgi:hypothetical protein